MDVIGEYLVLYRTKLYETDKSHDKDPDFFKTNKGFRIFEVNSHDLMNEEVNIQY